MSFSVKILSWALIFILRLISHNIHSSENNRNSSLSLQRRRKKCLKGNWAYPQAAWMIFFWLKVKLNFSTVDFNSPFHHFSFPLQQLFYLSPVCQSCKIGVRKTSTTALFTFYVHYSVQNTRKVVREKNSSWKQCLRHIADGNNYRRSSFFIARRNIVSKTAVH